MLDEQHPQKNWKVKVYLLNQEGNWNDYGAGQLSLCKEMDEITELDIEYFKVMQNTNEQTEQQQELDADKLKKLTKKYKPHQQTHNNSNNSPTYNQSQNTGQICLLYLKLNKDNDYDKQGESIITWVDKDIQEEVALSFLDSSAATETWRHICQSIGKNPDDAAVNEDELNKLPMPEYGNLSIILENIEIYSSKMIQLMGRKPEFMDRLVEIFEKAEDIEDDETLFMIYQICRSLVLLNDVQVLSILISDQYYKFCFGAFEYKPENQGDRKNNYRDFIENQLKFKQVVEIKDQSILQKIHQNYRLYYLKDSIIASYIEDTTASQINYNNTDICNYFLCGNSSQELLQEYFDQFLENVQDSIGFLIEFQQIIKITSQGNIYQNEKNQLFMEKISQFKIFEIFTASLQVLQTQRQQARDENNEQQAQKITQKIIELLECFVYIITIQPNRFVSFLLQKNSQKFIEIKKEEPVQNGELKQDEDVKDQDQASNSENSNKNKIECTPQFLLEKLSELFIKEDIAIKMLIGQEIMRILFEASKEDKNQVFSIVQQHFLALNIQEIRTPNRNNLNYTSFIIQLLEILIIIYKSNLTFKVNQFFIQEKVYSALNEKLKQNNKSVNQAIIKFYRLLFFHPYQAATTSTITSGNSSNDPNIKYIVKNKHMDGMLNLFIKNGNRTNLINSSLLELFEFIAKNNVKIAITYIINNWMEKLKGKKLDYLFQNIVLQHEKNQEKEDRGDALFNLGQNPVISDEQQKNIEMQEEEKYYDEDDEEEEDILQQQGSLLQEKQQQDSESNNNSSSKQQTEEQKKQLENFMNKYRMKKKEKELEDEDESDVFSVSNNSNSSGENKSNSNNNSNPFQSWQQQQKQQQQLEKEDQENKQQQQLQEEDQEENKIQQEEDEIIQQQNNDADGNQDHQKISINILNKKRKKSDLEDDQNEEEVDYMSLQSLPKMVKLNEEDVDDSTVQQEIQMDIEQKQNNSSSINNSNSNNENSNSCSSSNTENGIQQIDLSKSKLIDNTVQQQQESEYNDQEDSNNNDIQKQSQQQQQEQQVENA